MGPGAAWSAGCLHHASLLLLPGPHVPRTTAVSVPTQPPPPPFLQAVRDAQESAEAQADWLRRELCGDFENKLLKQVGLWCSKTVLPTRYLTYPC